MNLRDLISSVSSGLQKGKENLSNWVNVATNPIKREEYTKNVIEPTVQRVSTIAQMPFNPYGRAQINNFVQSKTRPNIAFNKRDFYGTSKSNEDQLKILEKEDTGYDLLNSPTSGSSAEIRPWFTAPTSEPRAQILRDVQVNTGGYTPQVQQYLKTIPFITTPEDRTHGATWAAGSSYSGNNMSPFIDINSNNYGMRDLASHELTHQIDAVSRKYKPEDFLKDYQMEINNNPEVMAPIIGFIENYKKQQPNYFQERGDGGLASELYAQIGAVFGPSILNSPTLSKYYQGVFQETPENYSGWVTPGPTPVNPNKPPQPTIIVTKPLNGKKNVKPIGSKPKK